MKVPLLSSSLAIAILAVSVKNIDAHVLVFGIITGKGTSSVVNNKKKGSFRRGQTQKPASEHQVVDETSIDSHSQTDVVEGLGSDEVEPVVNVKNGDRKSKAHTTAGEMLDGKHALFCCCYFFFAYHLHHPRFITRLTLRLSSFIIRLPIIWSQSFPPLLPYVSIFTLIDDNVRDLLWNCHIRSYKKR